MTTETKGSGKGIVITIVVLAALVGVGYGVKQFISNLDFNFSFPGGISSVLSQLTSASISAPKSTSGVSLPSSISVPVTIAVDNLNKTPIVLNNVSAGISYNGNNVINTTPGSAALKKITIPANTKGYAISDNVNVLLNQSAIQLLTDSISGKKPSVSVNLGTTLFGFPLKTKFNYNISL